MPSASQLPSPDHASTVQVLAEHYQKTNELTYALRQERDRFFIYLLVALAVVTLFNFDATASKSLLVEGTLKFLNITEPGVRDALRSSPLLGFVQTILLAAVFYLMSNLYNRTVGVLRNYQYIGGLEKEIRLRLGFQEGEVSFTREGGYYWTKRPTGLEWSKIFYTGLLTLLLVASFAFRIKNDVDGQNWLLATIDLLIAIPTAYYLWNYAHAASDLDKSGTKQ